MSVERIFDELGHFKRFQACVYFAAVFQATACGIHYLASVFLVETPDFVCGAPANVTDVLFGNLSGTSVEDFLPLFKAETGPLVVRTTGGEQWELSRCRRALRIRPGDFAYAFDGNKSVEACVGGFVYDRSEVYQSIVTDWDLVCDRAWLAKLCQPTFMLGVLVGALVFGDLADRVGRVKILMFASLCQFGIGVCVAFSANYYYFVAFRFLLAMASSGYLVVVFVYVTEFTGIEVRTWTSMHVHAAFAVGVMVVALTGYLVRVWWIYQIVLSLCTSPFLLFCWKFPETPFYLIAKGKYEQAQALLDAMARVNGSERRLKVEELLESEEQNGAELLEKEEREEALDKAPQRKLSILDLFGSWRMAGRTCTVWAIWFIGSLGYYVFSLGSVNLGGNQCGGASLLSGRLLRHGPHRAQEDVRPGPAAGGGRLRAHHSGPRRHRGAGHRSEHDRKVRRRHRLRSHLFVHLRALPHHHQVSGGGQRQHDVPRRQRGGAVLRVPGRRLDLPASAHRGRPGFRHRHPDLDAARDAGQAADLHPGGGRGSGTKPRREEEKCGGRAGDEPARVRGQKKPKNKQRQKKHTF
ncbi:solute carrier family 22 member 16 isoform X3 [Phyllopteryx taeniolatus]|uniref:solute carrier family 22 member 16 isoform X3 n=1 Tax=Phyllopteryx taeniolatus TaxID=161469 RepID=UPI002AD3521E|nr:solute carrier family 22 member 16 isoform X3 [Phyllopteryx taeniolatus]